MTDIDLAKLKELAARLLNPTDRFSEVRDKFDWKAVTGPAVISALIERLEAMQRERDEAVAELNRRDDAVPFAFGISDPDGDAYFDDFCIASDPGCLEDYVHALNDQLEDGMQKFTVVPLYAAAPAAEPEKVVKLPVKMNGESVEYGGSGAFTMGKRCGINEGIVRCAAALDAAGVKWVEGE